MNNALVRLAFRFATAMCLGVVASSSLAQNVSVPVAAVSAEQTAALPDRLGDALHRVGLKSLAPWICVTGVAKQNYNYDSLLEVPADLTQINTRFQLHEQKVGELTVLAPREMTVLSADVPPPDPYSRLSQDEAFKLLVASLRDEQWNKLISNHGLGLADLSSDDQRNLWDVVLHLPQKVILLKNRIDTGLDSELDITKQAHNLRLVLDRHVTLYIPTNKYGMDAGKFHADAHKPEHAIENGQLAVTKYQTFNGSLVYPNQLKKSDLQYDSGLFNVLVPLTGTEELGSLLSRIAIRTGTELYCDVRMAKLRVDVSPGAARAGDILKSLALGVTGTYRRVGPAYMLTNDLVGLGTKAKIIDLYRERADRPLSGRLENAADIITARHCLWDVPVDGDKGLDITLEQRLAAIAADPHYFASSEYPNSTTTFAQLSPRQREIAQATFDQLSKNPQADPDYKPRLDGSIYVRSETHLHMILPGLDGQVTLELPQLYLLFDPTGPMISRWCDIVDKWRKPKVETILSGPRPPVDPRPLLTQFVALSPRRAIVVNAQGTEEADAAVQKAQSLGFNEVWLNVFSALSAPRQYSSGQLDGDTMSTLREAIKAGRKSGVAVSAYVNLLTWPETTRSELTDLNLAGETSADAYVRWEKDWDTRPGKAYRGPAAKDVPVAVDPLDPRVQSVLLSIHRQLAAVTGLAGVVWTDTGMKGYADITYDQDEFGYALPIRLAYLRHAHIDPVDITPTEYGVGQPCDLPGLECSAATSKTLFENWQNYRAEVLHGFLGQLRGAVDPPGLPASKTVPVIVAERWSSNYPEWYGSWDSASASLPMRHVTWQRGLFGPGPDDLGKQAHMQSRISYGTASFWPMDDYGTMLAASRRLTSQFKWDGIVVYGDVHRPYGNDMWPSDKPSETLKLMDKLLDSLNTKPGTAAPRIAKVGAIGK